MTSRPCYDPEENISRHSATDPEKCDRMGKRQGWELIGWEKTNDSILNPLLSLWENKSESQIFNCRYSGDLSVYFLAEWRKSRFLIKVLCSKHPGLFSAESDRRGLRLIVSLKG